MLQRIFFMTDILENALKQRISTMISSGLVAPGIDVDFLAHAVGGLLWAGLLKIVRRTLTHESRDEFVSSLSAFIRRFLVEDRQAS